MYSVKADVSNISAAVKYIQEQLESKGCQKKKIMKTALLSEEIMVQMINNASEDSDIEISFGGRGKRSNVIIKCRGEKFSISDSVSINTLTEFDFDTDYNREQSSIISDLILKSYSSDISYKHSRGINYATIRFPKEAKSGTRTMLLALFSGLAVGLLFKFALPVSISDFISVNILQLISNIFIRGMGFVVGPLVFFSIASSVTDFGDMKAFGRIGGKIIGTYMCTTIVAVCIGFAAICIINPGDASLLPFVEKMSQTSIETTAPAGFSITSMILDMVPKTFMGPFVESNMLQIIVIAIIFGFASTKIGEHSESVIRFIKIGNSIFTNMIAIIVKMLPLSIFCLMANLMITIDLSVLDKVIMIDVTAILALLCMILVYSILLMIVGKVNPLKFWKNHKDAIVFAFSTCSSSATIPTSMRCLDRFGVSPKMYSFSIPLGATINMDGASITYLVSTLAMARIFGIEITGAALISLFISIMFISMGTPGVANAGVAFQMLLLTQIGIPGAAVAFLMPLSAIVEFFDTVINVCGDGVVTTIIARTENMLNQSK